MLGRACVQQREKERASERATSRTGVSELRFHAVSLADSEMDVRFFPAPPSSVGSCTLPTDSGLDYYHPNKVTHRCFFLSTLLRCGKIAQSCVVPGARKQTRTGLRVNELRVWSSVVSMEGDRWPVLHF